MSLTLITNPTSTLTLSSQWTDFVNREDHSNIGTGTSMPIFRLTNWDTGTARPLVSEGAIIEVGGSLYQADSDTALVDDTGLVNGLCFIKLVPGTGTPDPTTVVPTLTSDAMPAFDAEQGGWYDGDNKFLPILMTRSGSGTSYINKGEYVDQNKRIIHYIDGGSYFDGSSQVGGALTVGSGATFGGALSVGAGAAFNGAVSGVTDVSVSGSYLTDLKIGGNLFPTTTSIVYGVIGTLADGETALVPRGFYAFNRTGLDVEILLSGTTWVRVMHEAGAVAGNNGGFVFSDGANVRLANNSGGNVGQSYIQF